MGKTISTILSLNDKCSPQLEKFAKKLNISVDKAKALDKEIKKLSKTMGEGLKKASVVCSAAVGAVALASQQLVTHTMQAGDRIDKMSQKIGMSRKAFQEWDYIMSQNGGAVDNLQMGYKALSNQMEMMSKGSKDSIQYFNRLGVSVKDSRGNFRKQEDVFNDTVRALQRLKNPTEKAIIANKLFGKSAIDMKPLLNQSAASVEQLRKRANDLGMIMSDETVDAAVKLTDTMDTVKRSMSAFGVSIGAELLPIIQEMSNKFIENMPKIKATVMPVINGFINTFKFLAKHINLVTFAAVSLTTAFVSFNVITGVIKIITTLQRAIQLVTVAQGVWNAIMLANPIAPIALGIGVFIGLIVLLAKNWDSVTEAVKNFGRTAIEKFQQLWEKIKPIFEKIIKFSQMAFSFTPVGIAVNAVQTIQKNKPIKNALGTASSSGGASLVGEYGPEIVNLPRGSSVTPANKTQQILQGGKNVELHLHVAGNIYGEADFMNKIINRFTLELNKVMPV